MSGAVTATAAIVGAMTLTEVFTAVAITGAVVGAVGAVTGIKPLQYAGIALGVVGGLGGLAVAAGAFGAGAAALGEVAAGTTAAETMVPAFEGTGVLGGAGEAILSGGPTATMAAAPDVIGSIVDAGGGVTAPGAINYGADIAASGNPLDSVATAAGSPQVAPQVTPIDNSVIPQGDGGLLAPGDITRQAGVPTPDSGVVPGAATPPSSVAPPAPEAPTIGPAGEVTVGGQPVTAAPPPNPPWTPAEVKGGLGLPMQGQPSAWTNIMEILGKPGVGTLAGGGIQAIGSFLSGAMDPKNAAAVTALQAQANANQAAANLSEQQLRNMQGRLPVAYRTPVTGAPAGLINQGAA